jgi:hypothetical protein
MCLRTLPQDWTRLRRTCFTATASPHSSEAAATQDRTQAVVLVKVVKFRILRHGFDTGQPTALHGTIRKCFFFFSSLYVLTMQRVSLHSKILSTSCSISYLSCLSPIVKLVQCTPGSFSLWIQE